VWYHLQYKKEAPRVEALLSRKGWKAAAIHGDISQAQRTAAVEAFKAGTCPLLIATDVAARGLDIPDVEVVVNYSFPLTIEDYVHRIGRTGRAGKTGTAVTFFVGNNDKQRAGRQTARLCVCCDIPAEACQHNSSA
jgi:ATP-dependent RNA helicase DBP3